MDRLLRSALNAYIHCGSLRITTPSGNAFVFGDATGAPLAVRITSQAALRRILLNPELALGECYMDQTLVLEQGTLPQLLQLLMSQHPRKDSPRWARLPWLARYISRRWRQFNPRRRAQRNAAHHYDLNGRLYALFLDADRQYSCAYFERPDQSLDDAQLAKKRRLAAKLLLSPNMRVLDIGSGWGGLGLYLADIAGAQVTGITLSQEQLAASRERAGERGLSDRVTFELQDYRDVEGSFDRIVSVGMFEHVGVGFYGAYFRKCAQALADDGVMVLHSIGRSEGPGVTSPWISKYIFPGGYIPALSEVLPAIERAGLLVTDIEILRLHYAETLKNWRERFLAHREEVERLYDARFVRMWEFYLACSEMAFREQNMMVFQIQLAKRQGVVPITRDYVARGEAHLRKREQSRRPPLQLAGE